MSNIKSTIRKIERLSYLFRYDEVVGLANNSEIEFWNRSEVAEAKVREMEANLQQVQDRHFDELKDAVGDACAWQYWRDKARQLEAAQRAERS
jgi:hypothetical protein